MVKLLSSDNTLIVVARSDVKLRLLSEKYPNIKTYTVDLSQVQQYAQLADQIIRDYGQIDILVNNSAIQNTPTYLDDDFNYDSIAPEIHLNFTAVCSLSYLLLPALLQDSKQTVIANINSGLALTPKTNSAIYCASKAAMDSFSQSLAYQLEDSNIRVMQAFLPMVDTPNTRAWYREINSGAGSISHYSRY